MRFVFVMDGLDRVNPDKDTSYGFIEAAVARGHDCLHARIDGVEHKDGHVSAVTRELAIIEGPRGGLRFASERTRTALAEVDAVFIRKDPPFDAAYWHATLLLEYLRGTTVVLNDPRGLREANEKLYALNFPRWTPRMLVSSDRETIHGFVAELGGKAVIKPIDGAGGWGVMAVCSDDGNASAIVDMLTEEGSRIAIVQQFLPEVSDGDKRVLMLDGELLGAILRVPKDGDLRANIHVGAEVVPCELNERERALVADVGVRLRQDGLVFVGLDLIGEQLTEVNVTSPTGIRELENFCDDGPTPRVIAWVENAARTRSDQALPDRARSDKSAGSDTLSNTPVSSETVSNPTLSDAALASDTLSDAALASDTLSDEPLASESLSERALASDTISDDPTLSSQPSERSPQE